MKRLDVEKLLIWTYEELSKGGDVQSNQWSLHRLAELGTVVDDQLGFLRKAPPGCGEPHADALKVHEAIRDLGNRTKRTSGHLRATEALLILHAKMRTRPDWHPEPIRIFPERDGTRVKIVGKNIGKSRGIACYSEGSYCNLRYEPTLAEVEHGRGEYSAWHAGLTTLANSLRLVEHMAIQPSAPAKPWIDPPAKVHTLKSLLTNQANHLTDYGSSNFAPAAAGA